MNPLPRTGSYLIDSMLLAAGAICFTVAVGLVVLVGALLIQAIMLVSGPYVGSRSAASVLAILVFAAYVGVPSYLIAIYADDPEGRGAAADTDETADLEPPADPGEQAAEGQVADDRAVTALREEEPGRDVADSEAGPSDEHGPEAARCHGARPEGEYSDPPEGEGP